MHWNKKRRLVSLFTMTLLLFSMFSAPIIPTIQGTPIDTEHKSISTVRVISQERIPDSSMPAEGTLILSTQEPLGNKLPSLVNKVAQTETATNIDSIMAGAGFVYEVQTGASANLESIRNRYNSMGAQIIGNFVVWQQPLTDYYLFDGTGSDWRSLIVGSLFKEDNRITLKFAINSNGDFYIGSYSDDTVDQLFLFLDFGFVDDRGNSNYWYFQDGLLSESIYGTPKDKFMELTIRNNLLAQISVDVYGRLHNAGHIVGGASNGFEFYNKPAALWNKTGKTVIVVDSNLFSQRAVTQSWQIEKYIDQRWSPIGQQSGVFDLSRSFELSYVNTSGSYLIISADNYSYNTGSVLISGLSNVSTIDEPRGTSRVTCNATANECQVYSGGSYDPAGAVLYLKNQYPSSISMQARTSQQWTREHFSIATFADDVSVTNVEEGPLHQDNNPEPHKLIIPPGVSAAGLYTVTFNSNGGTAVPSQTVPHGSSLTKPADPSRPGFRFSGWFRDSTLTVPWNFASDVVTSNITLYAKWTVVYIPPAQYRLSTAVVPENTGTIEVDPMYYSYSSGTLVTLAAVPTTGYHFVGWSGDASGQDNPLTISMNYNKSITANFAVNTYSITASASNGGTISPSGTITATYGTDVPIAIEAEKGFLISNVTVDDKAITFDGTTTYTYVFSNISADHCINVTFSKEPDKVPPLVTLQNSSSVDLNNPDALVQINTATFDFSVTASDESGIARLLVKLNSATVIEADQLEGNLTIAPTEGLNNVEVTVYDTQGNFSTKSFILVRDTNGPVIDLPDNLPTVLENPLFTLSGSVMDALSGLSSFSINGEMVQVTASNIFNLQITLGEGENDFVLEATDILGNKTIKEFTITYNPPPPQVTTITVELRINNPNMIVNGNITQIDAQGSRPIIKNNRTLVPIRAVVEALGGTVEWDGQERKVTAKLENTILEIWIGNNIAKVDGMSMPIYPEDPEVVPVLMNDRSYVPVRFVCEKLGAVVSWNDQTKGVTITYTK